MMLELSYAAEEVWCSVVDSKNGKACWYVEAEVVLTYADTPPARRAL